ncbi:SRPBCC family protein [Lentzea sp. NPDC060358]|uniref:SRPBCC family protein n=1 Tax=Lentzea sp. NPDC060358 TaxID=3347103 RepID=UPI0036519BE1
MIHVTCSVPVNEEGQPVVTRDDLWKSLVLKANNALPFVPAMSHCEIVERLDEHTFDREIELFGERQVERVSLYPESRVVFTRVAGSVLGTIVNDIEDTPEGLRLRFSFALVVEGVQSGSEEERVYADNTVEVYFAAARGTLAAVRRMTRDKVSPDAGEAGGGR